MLKNKNVYLNIINNIQRNWHLLILIKLSINLPLSLLMNFVVVDCLPLNVFPCKEKNQCKAPDYYKIKN